MSRYHTGLSSMNMRYDSRSRRYDHSPRRSPRRTMNFGRYEGVHGYRTTDGLTGRRYPAPEENTHSNFNRHVYNRENINNWRGAPEHKDVLTIRDVSLQIRTNSKNHRTDEYEISSPYGRPPKLVVRRGQPFVIAIDFSKQYDPKKDDLRLVFEAGDKPMTSKGTKVSFILSDKDLPGEWGAKVITQKGNVLYLNIFTPPDLFVGKWDMSVDVVKRDNDRVVIYTYEHDEPVYIIFNPWNKEDSVYMASESNLKEYVMAETGIIYIGNKNKISERPWNYGQFESCVLDVAFLLLDMSGMNWQLRGDPVAIVRKLSALVNSQDDDGVLTGNWSGDYSGGRSPLSWSGSAAILEKFWKTRQPVRFGQCWVFSGVSTALCRALGIPARSVTNFASAHDTDGSITIDVHYRSDAEPDDEHNTDSVWNFHVWNEAWMARADLPTGFGGWQAFDATPQESSEGVYRCGPVSVQALKQGEVNLPYDAHFVFAEVNADKVYWMPGVDGTLQCMSREGKAVGKHISTKAANSWEREDITLNYKPEEGSAAERAVVMKANQLGSKIKGIYECKSQDVEFEIVQDAANTWLGYDFEVSLNMKNKSKEARTVEGRIVVKTMFYTGVTADKLRTEPFQVKIEAGKEKSHKVVIKPNQYDGKLKDCAMLDLSVWAVVKETKQHFVETTDCRLRKPHLSVKAPKQVPAGEEFNVDVSFPNPLDSTLTECFIAVDGLSKAIKFHLGNIRPKGTLTASLPITPKRGGQKDLILIFNSKQLEDVNASVKVFVQPVKEEIIHPDWCEPLSV